MIKVQGDRAVIQMLDSDRLEKDLIYHLDESAYDSEFGAREHDLGLSVEISSLFNSAATSVNTNTYSASLKFGWNRGWYEFGPTCSVSSIDKSGAVTATYSAGFFYDVDFRENRPGVLFVMGLGAKLLPGAKVVSSGSTSNYFNITTEVGPKTQWFLGHSSTSLRLDLVYHYEDELNYTNSKPNETSGLRLLASIESYF